MLQCDSRETVLKAGNPVTMPYCNNTERLMGISAGYFGTVIVEVDLSCYLSSPEGSYLWELGDVKVAASGTAALNFSRGKYNGLGIPTLNDYSYGSTYLLQKTKCRDEYIETIPSEDWVSVVLKVHLDGDSNLWHRGVYPRLRSLSPGFL